MRLPRREAASIDPAAAGGSFWFTTADPGPRRPAARGRRHVEVLKAEGLRSPAELVAIVRNDS